MKSLSIIPLFAALSLLFSSCSMDCVKNIEIVEVESVNPNEKNSKQIKLSSLQEMLEIDFSDETFKLNWNVWGNELKNSYLSLENPGE